MRIAIIRWFGVVMLLVASVGCDWVTKSAPEEVRVRLEGNSDVTVQLITSTAFLSNKFEGDGTDNSVVIFEADTIEVALPFEQEYDISRDQRFLAQAVRLAPESDELLMQAWVDGRKQYDKSGATIPEDSLLQFVYVYRSNQPSDDGRL